MMPPDPTPATVEELFGDPALVRIYRGALALHALRGETPAAEAALAQVRARLADAVFNPERLPLADRLVVAQCLHEAGPVVGQATLSTLGDAIADDVIDLATHYVAESAALFTDLVGPERNARLVRLLFDRLAASPPPPVAPVDLALAAQLYGQVRAFLAPWRTRSAAWEG